MSAQVNSAAEAFADFLFFVVQPNSRATNVVYHNTHNRQHTRMEERHFLSLLFSRFLFHYFMTRAHIKEGRLSVCLHITTWDLNLRAGQFTYVPVPL